VPGSAAEAAAAEEEYWPLLFSIAYGMTGSVGDAEDLVQDAFAGLARARRAEGAELARRFFEAADGGDLDALLGMLAPDVVFQADGGGKAQAIAAPLHGGQRVARLLAGLSRRGRSVGASLRMAWVNGQPGAVGYDAEGRVFTVFELDVADGVIQAIRAMVNPAKLGHLGPVSDVARLPEKELPQHRHNTDEGENR
jgi:ketosteroid isomerase-like protein